MPNLHFRHLLSVLRILNMMLGVALGLRGVMIVVLSLETRVIYPLPPSQRSHDSGQRDRQRKSQRRESWTSPFCSNYGIKRRSSRSMSRYRTRSPKLSDVDYGRIAKFTDEIESSLESRPEFDRFPHREMETTAKIMYSYGILSIEELGGTKKHTISFL